MSTKRRDELLGIQAEVQKKWESLGMFEENAPDVPNSEDPKFLCTFPYPYMNGRLHLGHAFTLSKAEFMASYKRLTGHRCLFPFGFHTTGMPIQACANKLRKEIERFGNPPKFPDEEESDLSGSQLVSKKVPSNSSSAQPGKSSKGKAVSKASRLKYQWEILRESGVPEENIARFADPLAWLDYFPEHGVADLKRFGLKVDWRRSFITTDVNPYYDSFVRWQFNTLRSLNKVKFGKRYAVYSTIDNQACADHDRSVGEGIQPQEYTIIKMKLLEVPKSAAANMTNRNVFLPAATLRPETMYGQTNCWVLPTGDYYAYEVVSGDIFIMSEHSARNMAYQNILPQFGEVQSCGHFKGTELIGLPLSSPNSTYDVIYVLPLLTVSMSKGTGIVTSVPSDAPDDYRGLMDLKEKPGLRAKFSVKDEWLMSFEPVPIIETPGFGNLAAVEACSRHKIKSQNDKETLAKAKEEVYKAGFYSGTMLVGICAGEAVQQAKPKIREELIASNQAVGYCEPEGRVVDRNGEDCVVALCDQWYLEYGEREWRAQAEKCLASMELYAEETRRSFISVLEWLREWACSRSFGLGTRLPWDADWIIESLSDSTVYMAYYTVAHLLQGGVENMQGRSVGPSGISAEEMTDAAWNYVLLGKESPGLNMSDLAPLRKEFLYWYPVDLRVSGKDLVANHLSFFIYNHVAIFPEQHWPRGIRSNGHVTLNAEKMSKSTGNFITLAQAVSMFTADGVRFALADAGDAVEDANFSTKTADDALLKLWTLIDFVDDGIKATCGMRTGPITDFHDRVFAARINYRAKSTQEAYERMLFRDALKSGFFELKNDLGFYREAVGADKTSSTFVNMHRDVFIRYVHVQALLLAPICPHAAEHIWGMLSSLEESKRLFDERAASSIMRASWPRTDEPNQRLLAADDYLNNLLTRIRTALVKSSSKKKKKKGQPENGAGQIKDVVKIFVCKFMPAWQRTVIDILRDSFDSSAWHLSRQNHPNDPSQWWKFPSDIPKRVLAALPPAMKKNKKVMPFVAKVRKEAEGTDGASALGQALPFDEESVLKDNLEFIRGQLKSLQVTQVEVLPNIDGSDFSLEALPGVPAIEYTVTVPRPMAYLVY